MDEHADVQTPCSLSSATECCFLLLEAGFIKSPLSQKRLAQDSVELYCEAIGNPIPEIQWWFEGNDPNETHAQLWDGARQDRGCGFSPIDKISPSGHPAPFPEPKNLEVAASLSAWLQN
ncbi:hypothetical protein EK904_012943 [Melospiza melodia maxima]|nr:hypothetical protein EK904_012943 [Melospiza melodia maxima]